MREWEIEFKEYLKRLQSMFSRLIPLAEKPANINDRYFELKKNLFRDLKYLGIDG